MAGANTEWLETPGRVAAVAALAASVVGVAVFGSLVAGLGVRGWDWAEDRNFATIATWALPGLTLAVLAGLASIRALFVRKGRTTALALSLLVALSLVSLILLNPPTAPPVP